MTPHLRTLIPALLISLAVLAASCNYSYAQTVKEWSWSRNVHLADLALADVDGDGVYEVVAAFTNGVVCAVEVNGPQLWSISLSSMVHTRCGMVVEDVDDDGVDEVLIPLFSRDDGYVACMVDSGQILWTYSEEYPANVMGGVHVADVDNDGHLEAIVLEGHFVEDYDNPSKVLVLDARSGAVEVSYQHSTTLGGYDSVLYDLDRDGHVEVLVHDERGCIDIFEVLQGLVRLEYQYRVGPGVTTGYGEGHHALGDFDGDGLLEVLVADRQQGVVWEVDSLGVNKYSVAWLVRGYSLDTLVAINWDGDQVMDYAGVSRDHKHLYVFEGSKLLYSLDVNASGEPIVVGFSNGSSMVGLWLNGGYLFVKSGSGEVVWSKEGATYVANGDSCCRGLRVGDVDADGAVEVVYFLDDGARQELYIDELQSGLSSWTVHGLDCNHTRNIYLRCVAWTCSRVDESYSSTPAQVALAQRLEAVVVLVALASSILIVELVER